MTTRSAEVIPNSSHAQAAAIRTEDWRDYHNAEGGPNCLLTTIGRKFGQPGITRVNYRLQGDYVIVVGSIAGLDKHPLWILNLEANSNAELEMKHGKWQVTARKVTGAERLHCGQR